MQTLLSAPPADLIKNARLFSGLEEEKKELLLKDGQSCFCPRKHILFRQGDPVTHFYLIRSGTFRLFHFTPDGSEITTDVRRKGDTLGTMGLLLPAGLHHANAEATEDATVLEFSRADFKKYAQHAKLSHNLMTDMAQRIYAREIEAEQRSTMNATQILACFLHRLHATYDLNPQGFDLPYSKSLIAQRLGLQRETLSRAISRLNEYGIAMKDKHVVIDNIETVKKSVCANCSYQDLCPAYKSMRNE